MKWSQFNVLFYSKKMGYYLHNTRMLSLIKLDEENYNKLLKIRENPDCAKLLLGETDYTYFVESKVLVSEQEDNNFIEKLEYKKRKDSFVSTSLGLVLCPTLACNFACPYCYEKKLPNNVMSEIVQSQLINFINKYAGKCKFITLDWHGGEPLLAFETIKQIYSRLENESKLPISSSSMVTNGYLLNEDICNYLASKELNYLQITIDGNKFTHNKSRILKNGGSSFEKIVENIDMAVELMPNCCIGVRTNIGLLNKDEYVDLYNELSKRWKGKNCSIYHSFIVDNSYYSNCNKQCSQELSTKEKNDFIVNLAKNGIVKKELIYPQRDCSLYTCTNNNSFVIDPLGYLYKCWADVGIYERSVGNLVNGITNYDIFSRFMVGSDKFADVNCRKCTYLPICNGGCNLSRIRSLERKVPYKNCSIDDEGLIKYLETFLEMR